MKNGAPTTPPPDPRDRFDFLALDAVRPSERFRPLARSSMERRLREAGATFAERDGWLVAVRVPREDAHELGVQDVTHLHRVRESSEGVLIEFAPGEGRDPVVTGFLYGEGDGRPPEEGLVDLSAGYAALEVDGPAATTLMRRLTDLDLDDLPAVGAVAHVRTWVVRDGEETYRLLFPQEYGHYVWEVVVDAAEPLGGGAKGTATPTTPPPDPRDRP